MAEVLSIPQVMPWLGEAEAVAAYDAVASNWLSEGPRCAEFSRGLNALIGSPFGVFAPNGTLALVLALQALGVGPGDEVLVPDITFIGSANAVWMVGAMPIFVDVELETFQIDVVHAESLVSPRTRAIMPVHMYGTACDMTAIAELAGRHGLKVIEDAAQGIGVDYKSQHVGSFGEVGCFSFFADKTITTGEGGYVTCKDEATFDRLRYLRNQGRLSAGTFIHPQIGFNFRINEMQAAVGLVQLAKLAEIVERKRRIHAWYRDELSGLGDVRILGTALDSTHVPFRAVLVVPEAASLMEYLAHRGVQARSFFYPMHRQPCFAEAFAGKQNAPSLHDEDYPNAVYGYEHGLCLPVFPTLTQEQVHTIAKLVIAFYA